MLDKSALLAERTAETRDVPLPTLDGTVRVRGLTRAEAVRLQGKPMDADEAEAQLLALAMVEPALTVDEVRAWQRAAPAAELEPISRAIMELSGMTASAVKDAMSQFPG